MYVFSRCMYVQLLYARMYNFEKGLPQKHKMTSATVDKIELSRFVRTKVTDKRHVTKLLTETRGKTELVMRGSYEKWLSF